MFINFMKNSARKQLAEDLASLIPAFHQKFIFQVNFPVPPNHFITLIRLHDYGTQTITELSTRLLISKQQMSPIIEKLLSSGFVVRRQDPKDRRSSKISITEKGYAVLQSHHNQMVRSLDEKLMSLSDAEVWEFEENLRSFFKLFNRIP